MRIKEINSKSNNVVKKTFDNHYAVMFTQHECSKPEPNRDLDFDDFADLEFSKYKDVHIHAMDIYFTEEYLNGFEIYY
jgi:hypothetical protein